MATKEEIFKIGENYKSEQLEAQSRAAIKAWCDDPSVELEFMIKDGSEWIHKKNYCWFDLGSHHYRIAKPKKWYRVALFDDYVAIVANSDLEESLMNQCENFIKWLDERKYYD